MKMISLNEIKKMKKKSSGMVKLIEKMEKLEQGKVEADRVERAKETHHCIKCDKGLQGIESVDKGICHHCKAQEEAKKVEEEKKELIKKNWKELIVSLNKLSGGYKLKETTYGDVIIIKTDGDIEVRIYRDKIQGNGSWYSTGRHALRISTSDSEIESNKMKRDFGAKGVEEGLDKKCLELIQKIKDKKSKIINENKKVADIDSKIMEGFGVQGNEQWINVGRGRRERSHSRVFEYKCFSRVTTFNGDEFSIGGIKGSYSANQVKEMAKVIEGIDFKKEKIKTTKDGIKDISWKELRKLGKDLGIKVFGMKRDQLEKEIKKVQK